MDKEGVVYIHNGILLSHKKEHICVSSDELDEPELIIQSEVSQKEKDKYHVLTHISEKTMAPHSSTLAWKIPWMEEPGRLQSMASLRVRYD